MSEQLYWKPAVIINSYPGCCGIEIATNFDCEEKPPTKPDDWDDRYDGKWGKGGITLSEWHKKAEKLIDTKRRTKAVQLSLVTKYKYTEEEQAPGFKDYLLTKGWKILDVFVNPNHGNEVTVMSKVYTRAKKPKRPNWLGL